MLKFLYLWARHKPVRAALTILAVLTLATVVGVSWFIYSFTQANLVSMWKPSGMAWSPDGTRLAVSEDGPTGLLRILHWNNGLLQQTQSQSYSYSTRKLSWSPDGDWISCIDISGSIMSLRLSSGQTFQPFGPECREEVFAWSLPAAGAGDPAGPEIVGIQKSRENNSQMLLRARRAGEDGSSLPRFSVSLPDDQIQVGVYLSNVYSLLHVLPDKSKGGSDIIRHVSLVEHRSGPAAHRTITVHDILPVPAQSLGAEGGGAIKQVFTCDAPYYSGFDMCLSPDGSTMALMDLKYRHYLHFDLWNLTTGKKEQTLTFPKQLEPGLYIRPAWSALWLFGNSAWSADGKRFAAAIQLEDTQRRPDGCLLVWWDVATGKVLATKRVWMFNQNALILLTDPKSFPIAQWSACWSPTLDKVALWRRICFQPPYFPDYRRGRNVVSVVPAPPEVTK
ncbi:MAG: hypothetical protein ACAI35_04020 [Candidatus Methylacidiphilales bacterium]|nr:hypothetical protein [Candidatus Methylacidiphilales bacterium]